MTTTTTTTSHHRRRHHHQQQQQKQQASAEAEPQAATSGGLPTWGLPQGRNTNIRPFVGPATVVKKSDAPYTNNDRMPLFLLMLFFTEIVHLLVEQINVYYKQHLDVQARPSCQLPDITLPDMMTLIALALQMGHKLKDTLHDYWSRLRQLHTLYDSETMIRDRFTDFYTYCIF